MVKKTHVEGWHMPGVLVMRHWNIYMCEPVFVVVFVIPLHATVLVSDLIFLRACLQWVVELGFKTYYTRASSTQRYVCAVIRIQWILSIDLETCLKKVLFHNELCQFICVHNERCTGIPVEKVLRDSRYLQEGRIQRNILAVKRCVQCNECVVFDCYCSTVLIIVYLIHMTEYHMDLCSESCASLRLEHITCKSVHATKFFHSCHAYTSNRHWYDTKGWDLWPGGRQPLGSRLSKRLSSLIGTIDLYHFIPLSRTLVLPEGHKVGTEQNLLASFSCTFFVWSGWNLMWWWSN